MEKLQETNLKSDKKGKKTEKNLNKPLDIISLDEKKDKEEKMIKEQTPNSNEKISINEELDKKGKNIKIRTKSKEYHSEEISNISQDEKDEVEFVKSRRKTFDHSEIDKLIIKSFISKEFGNI